jgi:ABC-type nitrate/sulfonate/bicarbonate transport system ATPase subunit
MNGPIATSSNRLKPLLRAQDLKIDRGDRELLCIEHFGLGAGEVVALIGPSGCGKSTLLACLGGAYQARSGTVEFPGRDAYAEQAYISRSVQGAPLLHWLTVRQNLELAAKIKGVSLIDSDSVLARFAAEKLADRSPNTLSGGERCRASLSQAMVGEPKILLLDEPFTGLDVAVKRFVAQNIFSLARELGTGILMATHDLYDAVEYANRVIVLGGTTPARIVGELEASMDAIGQMAELLSQ